MTYLVVKFPYDRYKHIPMEVKVHSAKDFEELCRSLEPGLSESWPEERLVEPFSKVLKEFNGDGMSLYYAYPVSIQNGQVVLGPELMGREA